MKKPIVLISSICAGALLILGILFALEKESKTTNPTGQITSFTYAGSQPTAWTVINDSLTTVANGNPSLKSKYPLPAVLTDPLFVQANQLYALTYSDSSSQYGLTDLVSGTTQVLSADILSAALVDGGLLVQSASDSGSIIGWYDPTTGSVKGVSNLDNDQPLDFLPVSSDEAYYYFPPSDATNASLYHLDLSTGVITDVVDDLGYQMIINPQHSKIYYDYVDSSFNNHGGIFDLTTKQSSTRGSTLELGVSAWTTNGALVSLQSSRDSSQLIEVSDGKTYQLSDTKLSNVTQLIVEGDSTVVVVSGNTVSDIAVTL